MYNLILTIIAIAIFGIVVSAGMGYLNFDSIQAAGYAGKINAGLSSVSSLIAQHRMLEEELPLNFKDLEDDGYMRHKPQLPGNIGWPEVNQLKFNNADGALYVCMGGTQITSLENDVFGRIQSNLGSSSVVIGNACFLSSDVAIADVFPTTVWLTYRIQ